MAKDDSDPVGFGANADGEQIPVMSGDVIFKFLDSYGLPLDIMLLELESKGLAFDVLGFIKAAKNSGNYENVDRLRILIFSNLVTHGNEEAIKNNVNMCLELVYGPPPS